MYAIAPRKSAASLDLMEPCAPIRVRAADMPPFRPASMPPIATAHRVVAMLDKSITMGVIREWELGYKGPHVSLRLRRPNGHAEELFWPDPADGDFKGLLERGLLRAYKLV